MGQLSDIVRQSRSLGDSTRETYLICVGRFEGAYPRPDTWSPRVVEKWRDRLLKDVSAKTANKHLYALRYASRRREALGMGPDFAHAAEGTKAPHGERRRALTHEEVTAIVATTRGRSKIDIRDRALIILAVRTGLRVTALSELDWSRISGRRVVVKLKGGDKHVVILDDECVAALATWHNLVDRPRSGAVFPALRRGRPGEPMSRQAIHRVFADRGRAAGIRRPVHPHLFRHTFISWALAAGVPPQRVMIMTGHKSLSTLSGYVTDLDAERDPVGGHLPPLLRGE